MTGETGRNLSYGFLAIGSVAVASIIGQVATYPNLVSWYASLTKPWFTPPNWIFGPVWTTLYVLMAYALWRILRLPQGDQRSSALAAFFSQLGLNALWPWMFFGANSTALGLFNIVPQLAIIFLTIWLFLRIDRVAAWCLLPLSVWVTYATVLNAALWWLN
jgi:translocator protein